MSEDFVFDDGRKAEKLEIDQGKTKVIEIYVEPKSEKKLAKRITEKYCVCEREIETIDEITGEVVSKIVEKVKDGEVLVAEEPINNYSIENLVEQKIKSKPSVTSIVLTAVIVIQLLGLAYLLFASWFQIGMLI